MTGFIARALISGLIIAVTVEVAPKLPRVGALILSLPLVSIGALILIWWREQNLDLIAQISRETLILVPLGLGFFVPLAFFNRLGLSFWSAFAAGITLSTMLIVLWWLLVPPK